MRLWHIDLIPYLPRQQLVSQWRECCCIARSIVLNDTPNHILVNRIMDYPMVHFAVYSNLVAGEMAIRGYKVDPQKMKQWLTKIEHNQPFGDKGLFPDWHNNIYLRQCLYNLEEKAICGGIPANEWRIIYEQYKNFTPLWNGEQS